MMKNESGIDRVVRVFIALAAVLGAWAAGFGSVLGVLLLVVGAIMLVTAITGFCPLYRLFGLSTVRDHA